MNIRFFLISACCVLPATFLCWYLLTSGDARWLKIETSPFATPGEDFKVLVTLAKPEPGLYLGTDLHGMDMDRVSSGYISGTRHVKISPENRMYAFSIPVPHNQNTAFVFPIVILSRDGTWNTRTSAADTCAIPVITTGSGKDLADLVNRRARVIELHKTAAVPEPRLPSMAISVIWLAASITAALSVKKLRSGKIATAAAVLSLWELLNSSTTLGNALRLAARGTGIYNTRRLPQQVITVAVILLVTIIIIYLISSGMELYRILSWTSITIYSCISLLQVFSLHESDTLLSANIAGAHSGQVLRLAAATICILSTILLKKDLAEKNDPLR